MPKKLPKNFGKERPEIKYRWVKTLKPYCTKCGQTLGGDNSDLNPYTCKCGTWKIKIGSDGNFYYVLNNN